MDANTVTLIIGLSGIAGTLIASGLGLYFTAKARSSSLRETLFKKQLEIMARITHLLGRFRVFATILAANDNEYKEHAREDIRECIKIFSEIQEEGAAILPTELWIEVKKMNDHMAKIPLNYDKGESISKESIDLYIAIMSKIVLLGRVVIGVDELTEENIKLYSSQKEYENLANIELEYFKKLRKS
jgi:hypothetical protein